MPISISFDTNLESPWKKETQLRHFPDQIDPWPCLWRTSWIDGWHERTQPTAGSTALKQGVLGCVGKLTEHKPEGTG